jgi:hypothetical protein
MNAMDLVAAFVNIVQIHTETSRRVRTVQHKTTVPVTRSVMNLGTVHLVVRGIAGITGRANAPLPWTAGHILPWTIVIRLTLCCTPIV